MTDTTQLLLEVSNFTLEFTGNYLITSVSSEIVDIYGYQMEP